MLNLCPKGWEAKLVKKDTTGIFRELVVFRWDEKPNKNVLFSQNLVFSKCGGSFNYLIKASFKVLILMCGKHILLNLKLKITCSLQVKVKGKEAFKESN